MSRLVDPLIRRLHPHRIRRTFGAASCVREPAGFVIAELRNVPVVRRYRLRGSGLAAYVRHPLFDMWALEEQMRLRVYDPPEVVAQRLRALERPLRVLDLGGNAGYFGLFAFATLPVAEVVSFEPEPGNARLLERQIAGNGLGDCWRLVEACAAPADGDAELVSSGLLSTASPDPAATLEGEQERIRGFFPFLEGTPFLTRRRFRVESRDVFPFLSEADLIKIDIEGGEWALLADPRFAETDATALILEYHPRYLAAGDAIEVLRESLEGAGYQVGEPERGADAGLLWAWRERSS
ncbi:MAG: FkbM family methyltransferase [Solirubrobacterales bacterium]